MRLHTHLDEDRDETAYCLATFGCRPVEHFDELGWNEGNAWVAHCIFANEDEMARLGAGGTSVAHCPSSNMLIAGGATPVSRLKAHGVAVGLGCDGSASTDHASLWLEARTALLLGRLRDGAASMNARDALEMATTGSARCLGRGGELGALGVGAPADLVVWPVDGVSFAGAHTDLVEAWLRCGPVRPRHTVVNGRVVVRDGELQAPGLEEMLARHARIFTRLAGCARNLGVRRSTAGEDRGTAETPRPGDDRPGDAEPLEDRPRPVTVERRLVGGVR